MLYLGRFLISSDVDYNFFLVIFSKKITHYATIGECKNMLKINSKCHGQKHNPFERFLLITFSDLHVFTIYTLDKVMDGTGRVCTGINVQ